MNPSALPPQPQWAQYARSQAVMNAMATQYNQGIMNALPPNDPLLYEILSLRDDQPRIAKASWRQGFGWGVVVAISITLLFWLFQ